MRSKDPQSRNKIVKFVPIIHKVNINSQICSKDQQCKYKIVKCVPKIRISKTTKAIVKCLLKIRKMINKIRYIYIYKFNLFQKALTYILIIFIDTKT